MRYKNDVIALLEVPVGKHAHLKKIDNSLRAKLKAHGLYIGDRLCMLRVAPLGGPVLIEINGREIALGRELARDIWVEVECESH